MPVLATVVAGAAVEVMYDGLDRISFSFRMDRGSVHEGGRGAKGRTGVIAQEQSVVVSAMASVQA
jgi:hypothetical protein